MELMSLLGPVVVAMLTVPVMNLLKLVSGWIDNAPSWMKQSLVMGIATGLTLLGRWLNVEFPTELVLFDEGMTQALLSGLLASWVHDGAKGMGKPKLLAFAGALALLPSPAAAQADSVVIDIYDRSDLSVEIVPDGYRGFRGDTVTFRAVVVDAVSGDTLDVELIWSTDNPTAVDIDPSTGFATFLSRGRYNVYVDVGGFTGIVLLREPMVPFAEWTELYTADRAAYLGADPDTLQVHVGESVTLCGYTLIGGNVVEKSGVNCPDAVLGNTEALRSRRDRLGRRLWWLDLMATPERRLAG